MLLSLCRIFVVVRVNAVCEKMDVAANVVHSRAWVQGSTRISFGGRSDWIFFYSLEGVAIKSWSVLFYNDALKKIFLRTPTVDLKIKDIVVQKYKYVSNVYIIMLDSTGVSDTMSATMWSPDDGTDRTGPPTGIVTPSNAETYLCAPPVLFKDGRYHSVKSGHTLQMERTQHSPPDLGKQRFNVATVAGYTTYQTQQHRTHDRHFLRTWVPRVTVDSDTMECSFVIECATGRDKRECLECTSGLRHGETVNSLLSNLLVNH